MSNDDLFTTLRDWCEGRLSPEEYRSWWLQNEDVVKTLVSAGEFLRLKPKRAGGDIIKSVYGSFKEACAFLKRRDVDCDCASRVEFFDKYFASQAIIHKFGATACDLAMRKFAAQFSHDVAVRLHEEFAKSGEVNLEEWLTVKFSEMFLCVSRKPVWVDEPEWPFVDGQPLVFVTQFEVPRTEVSETHLTWDEVWYVFARRVPYHDGFKVENQIVVQTRF